MMNDTKMTLIIVDAQYDFAHEDGSLYVPNGNVAVQNIIDFIEKNRDKLAMVVFTMDNHPTTHCSFKENGGIWPPHCVQRTHGAEILKELIKVCDKNGVKYRKLKKGEIPGILEYTAFSRSRKIGLLTILRSETHNVIAYTKDFIVAGFAGDYCVKDSIADLGREVGMEHIKVFRDGVADIDDGTVFNKFIKENNLTVIDSDLKPLEQSKETIETIYMVANIKAYKGRVIPLNLHKSNEVTEYLTGEMFQWLCENADEGYSVVLDVNDFLEEKHKREEGFGKGRYRYFSNEENAKKYMLDHGWV